MRNFDPKGIILFLVLLIGSLQSRAQGKELVNTSRWEQPLAVVPNTIIHDNVEFPAHTITVHGTSTSRLFQIWRTDMSARSREISGRRPTVVRGVILNEIGEEPVVVLAEITGDRRAALARLTIAFAANDSTPMLDDGRQQRYMHELAIRYNQTSIQDHISDRQKLLARAQKKAVKAGADDQRTRKKLQRAEDGLQQARLKREREQTRKAKLQGDVSRSQARSEATNTEKDRKRTLQASRSLAKKESVILKYMEKEAKLESEINRHQGDIPDHERNMLARNAEVDRLERDIKELEAIRDGLDGTRAIMEP